MAGTVDHKELRLLVIGGRGVGKSTLVNGILGGDGYDATEAGCFEGGTRTVAKRNKNIYGVPVVIFDTPGLQESSEDDGMYVSSVIEEIKKKCQNLTLFLYCMNMTTLRLHSKEEDKHAIVKLTAAFGEDIWKHAVLVLTFANKEDVSRRDERDEDEGPEPHWDDDDAWKVLKKKRFEGRLEKWKEGFHKFLIEEVGIRKDIAERIPVVPAGDHRETKGNYEPYRLPDCDDWLDEFWKACSLRVKESILLAEINKHRILVKDAQMKPDKTDRQAEENCKKGGIFILICRSILDENFFIYTAQGKTPLKSDLLRIFRSSAHHFRLIGTALDVTVGDLVSYPEETTNNLIRVFERWIESNNDVTWKKILQVCEDYPEELGQTKAEVKGFLQEL